VLTGLGVFDGLYWFVLDRTIYEPLQIALVVSRFMLATCSASTNLKTVAVCSSEKSLCLYWNAWPHIPAYLTPSMCHDTLLWVTCKVNLSHVAVISLTPAPNMAQPVLTQRIWWCQWSMVLIWRPCRCRGRWGRVHTSTGSYKKRYRLMLMCAPLVLTC
jgi:hypothetical protein